MKTRRIQVKASQLDRLLDDLRAIPETPPSECLTDEQFVDYTLSNLSPAEVLRMDEHIAACAACAETLEHMLSEYERGRKRSRKRADILSEIFDAVVLSWKAFTRELLPLEAAPEATEGRIVWEWQNVDNSARAHAVLEPNGDLTFRFVSTNRAMVSQRLCLRCGSQRYEGVLQQVSPTEVGVKVVILKQERPESFAKLSLEFCSGEDADPPQPV
ncbi:MAG: zf-HC2 domain-containing protein [Verrucomicrobia bacterium]|nr:zf-HC2 domain-containing protein [Verrucomicrobiota bacterium]